MPNPDPDSPTPVSLAEAILASMTEGLIIADMAGNVVEMNPAALRLHGYGTMEEARRPLRDFQDIFTLRHPDGRPMPPEEWPVARAVRGETFTGYQVGVRRRDTGAEWWGSYGGTQVRGADGRPLRAVVTAQDVTAIRRAEQEMRYVTAHARCLLWYGTVTRFEDGGLHWQAQVFDGAASEAFCPLDLQTGESYTDAWYRHRLPEGRRLTDAISHEAFTAGLSHYSAEFGCRDRYGVVRWFSEEVHAEPLIVTGAPADPRVTGRWRVVGVSTDITERRQDQRLLEESRQRYKSLFDYNPDAVFSFDLHGSFLSANATCETVSGYSPDELLRMTFLPLLVPEERERVLGLFHLATQGHPQSFETTIVHKTGHPVPLAVTVVPTVVDNAIVGVYGVAKDITARRQAEQALQEATQRQRAFLRDVLASVTEGRLRLCETRQDLPARRPPVSDPIALTTTGGLRELRHATEEAAVAIRFPEERWHDLVTAVGEAGMNTIVHAGGGAARVCADGSDTVQVWVEDEGRGIAVEDLPHAALLKGYTTAGSLGHGMKMMLQTADRVWLLTGTTGTTVVLEQDRIAPFILW